MHVMNLQIQLQTHWLGEKFELRRAEQNLDQIMYWLRERMKIYDVK